MSTAENTAQPGAQNAGPASQTEGMVPSNTASAQTVKNPALDAARESASTSSPAAAKSQPIDSPVNTDLPAAPIEMHTEAHTDTPLDPPAPVQAKEEIQEPGQTTKRGSHEVLPSSGSKKSRNDDSASEASKVPNQEAHPGLEFGKKKIVVSEYLKIDNTLVFESCETLKQRFIGSAVYDPDMKFMRKFIGYYNGVLRILIRASDLKSANVERLLSERPLWGTNVYSDDSDLIACLLHSGKLQKDQIKDSADLCVTVVVLPALREYQGSYMGCLNSRTWSARHDGFSFQIEGLKWVKPDTAETRACNSRKRCNEWLRGFRQAHGENYSAKFLH